MIPLDSSKWSEFSCECGPATRVPELLRAIYASPHACVPNSAQYDVWEELWYLLDHQGTIYPAAFAAVPHLVEAALTAHPGVLDSRLIGLPLAIERSRLENNISGRKTPAEIDSDYFDAIFRLDDVCNKTAEWGRDPDLTKAVRMARLLLSKRRGNILPKQKADMGPLFSK